MTATNSNKLRVCVRLFEADYLKLKEVNRFAGNPGLNHIIRQIIHDYVTRLTDAERRSLDKAQPLKITIPEELLT